MPSTGHGVYGAVAVATVGEDGGAVYTIGWTAVSAASDDLPCRSIGFVEELYPLLLVVAFGDVEAVAPRESDVFIRVVWTGGAAPPPIRLPLPSSSSASIAAARHVGRSAGRTIPRAR